MERRFTILRIIGTLWKVLAWIVLVVGILSALGLLLASILGGGLLQELMRQWGQQQGPMPWAPGMFSVAGGLATFVALLIGSIIYFLALYAMGDLIFLLLAIEENTRAVAYSVSPRPTPPAPEAYVPAPPPAP